MQGYPGVAPSIARGRSGILGFVVNALLVFGIRRALPGGQDSRAVDR